MDRSFVSDLGASTKSDSIVKAIISLAHGLGMTVVAEGVETKAQRYLLAEFGCDEFQGYLFSRPRNATDIVELLRAKPRAPRGVHRGGMVDDLMRAYFLIIHTDLPAAEPR